MRFVCVSHRNGPSAISRCRKNVATISHVKKSEHEKNVMMTKLAPVDESGAQGHHKMATEPEKSILVSGLAKNNLEEDKKGKIPSQSTGTISSSPQNKSKAGLDETSFTFAHSQAGKKEKKEERRRRSGCVREEEEGRKTRSKSRS
eukprot:15191459-Ditylum_brightwellii.AAC.1